MNIKDLPQGSYTPIGGTLNIKDLQPGSYNYLVNPNTPQEVQGPKQPPKQTFMQDVASAFSKRKVQVEESRALQAQGKQDYGITMIQRAGQSAGLIADIGFSGIKHLAYKIAPHLTATVSQKTNDAVQGLAQTPIGKAGFSALGKGFDEYTKFRDAYPSEARTIESVVNVASLLGIAKPLVGGLSKTGQLVKTTTKTVAKSRVVNPIVTGLKNNAIKDLENTYIDLATGQSPTKQAKFFKAQKVTELKNEAGTFGTAPQTTLARNIIIPNQKEGKLATLEQAKVLADSVSVYTKANRQALQNVDFSIPKGPVNQIENDVIRSIQASNATPGNKTKMIAKAKAELDATRIQFGDTMGLVQKEILKSQNWGATKFDTAIPQLQRDVHYHIAKALQKNIEKTASSAGFKDVAQMNRHIGDILDASKFLEGLNGKVLKGGRLGKYALRTIGAISGSSHGPLGSILGAFGGDVIAGVLMDNSITGPVKRLILNNIQSESPDVYRKVLKFLEDNNAYRENMLRLPAPEPSGTSKNPITLPAPTTYEQQAKNINTVQPEQQKLLSAPTSDAQGIPITLPQSVRETNLGTDQTRRMKVSKPKTPIKNVSYLHIQARNYSTPEEFVKAQGTPKTVRIWKKSRFSEGGGYDDVSVIRKEENITLYQGGKTGDGRQFWTSNKKYAEQFGDVTEKTGTFYKIDNGNRVTDVYVEAKTPSQLTNIWKEANGKSVPKKANKSNRSKNRKK